MNNQPKSDSLWEKIKQYLANVFSSKISGDDKKASDSKDESDDRSYIEFLPIDELSIEQGIADAKGKLSEKGYLLPHLRWRWSIFKSKESETNNGGHNYDMRSWKLGFADGCKNIVRNLNVELIKSAIDAEKIKTYPAKLKQLIIADDAKISSVEMQRQHFKGRIKFYEKELAKNNNRLEQLEKKQEKIINERIQAQDEKVQKKAFDFARFIAGLMLILAGIVLVIADVALSITVIYAFGIKKVKQVSLQEAILDPEKWAQHWEGIILALGIASITFFFKYVYDRFIHHPESSRSASEKIIIGFIGMIALVTVALLAHLRAEYIILLMKNPIGLNSSLQFGGASSMTNQPAPSISLVVNETVAFWSMFLIALLFPIMGAICLSEGFNRLTTFLSLVLQSLVEFLSRIKHRIALAMGTASWNALGGEIVHLKRDIAGNEKQIEKLQETIFKLDADVALKEKLRGERLNALDEYEKRWTPIKQVEVFLYLHGYEWGQRSYYTQNHYQRAVSICTESILHRSNGSIRAHDDVKKIG